MAARQSVRSWDGERSVAHSTKTSEACQSSRGWRDSHIELFLDAVCCSSDLVGPGPVSIPTKSSGALCSNASAHESVRNRTGRSHKGTPASLSLRPLHPEFSTFGWWPARSRGTRLGYGTATMTDIIKFAVTPFAKSARSSRLARRACRCVSLPTENQLSIKRALGVLASGVAIAIVCAGESGATERITTSADADRGDPSSVVRVEGTGLRAALTTGCEQSTTFLGIVRRIAGTDGIVYVKVGKCGFGVRSCLPHTVAFIGDRRMLRILVANDNADVEAISSLAHELTHAWEVLRNPTIRTHSQMLLLYERIGYHTGLVVETSEAIAAGRQVRAELLSGHMTTFALR